MTNKTHPTCQKSDKKIACETIQSHITFKSQISNTRQGKVATPSLTKDVKKKCFYSDVPTCLVGFWGLGPV